MRDEQKKNRSILHKIHIKIKHNHCVAMNIELWNLVWNAWRRMVSPSCVLTVLSRDPIVFMGFKWQAAHIRYSIVRFDFFFISFTDATAVAAVIASFICYLHFLQFVRCLSVLFD